MVVGLVAIVLAGCSSGPGPDVGAPASSTPSASGVSPSPSVSSPTVPPTLDAFALERVPKAARAHTPQGAEAFARFYLEQVNRAWVDADPEQIRPYALASCKTCAGLVEEAERLEASGLHYREQPIQVGESVPLPSAKASRAVIQIVSGQLDSHIVRGDGTVDEHVPAQGSVSQLDLSWVETSWRVVSVKTL